MSMEAPHKLVLVFLSVSITQLSDSWGKGLFFLYFYIPFHCIPFCVLYSLAWFIKSTQ